MKDKMTIDQLMESMRSDDFGPATELFEQDAQPADAIPAPDQPPQPQKNSLTGADPGADDAEGHHGTMEAALNDQHNVELHNWYFYYTAAAWLDDMGFPGMASWMYKQGGDELKHAEKIYHFLLDRNQPLVMAKIEPPKIDGWKEPLDLFRAAHERELMNTDRFERLHQMATEGSDRQAASLINWFLDEQVEEAKVTLEIVQKLERVGKDGAGLNLMDFELGKGVAAPAGRLREDKLDESVGVEVNNNLTRVDLGKSTFWFSYKTCIAFDTPGTGLVTSENAWGNTTGKHINQVQPDKNKRIPNKEFEAQLEKVVSKAGRLREDKAES